MLFQRLEWRIFEGQRQKCPREIHSDLCTIRSDLFLSLSLSHFLSFSPSLYFFLYLLYIFVVYLSVLIFRSLTFFLSLSLFISLFVVYLSLLIFFSFLHLSHKHSLKLTLLLIGISLFGPSLGIDS